MFFPRPQLQPAVSSLKPQRSVGSVRRADNFYAPPSKRLYTPSSVSSKKHSYNLSQTSIVEETAHHIVENFGAPLPVLVTEAVTVAERITDVSVKLEESGWASLVCGRRLFVWRFKQEVGVRNMAIHCKDLTLPASDLAHKAELVHIFHVRESQMPAVIAVSPEGIVRYWPNIAHEGTSVDAAADLQGQECYSLTSVYPLGCILATTTGSLVLITPSTFEGQHTVICSTLKVPQGVLAGFGRRVSSFIFGAMPTQSSEAKQLNKVLSAPDENNRQSLYVLSGNTFQKWHLTADEPDKLLFESDIDRYVKEGFLDALWKSDSSHLHQLKTWCLDMQISQNGVILLVAGMNPFVSHQMRYAFGHIETTEVLVAPSFASFVVIKHSELYTEQDEEKLLSYRFLYPAPPDDRAFVYDSHKVIFTTVSSTTEPDVIEFANGGNLILGAGTCNRLPLLFTQLHGLVCLRSTQTQTKGSVTQMMNEVEDTERRLIPPPENIAERLRYAMVYANGTEQEKCQQLVDEVLKYVADSGQPVILDLGIITMSGWIIDDFPAMDPRWRMSVPASDIRSSSMIIMHQLEDKLKVHNRWLQFLKTYGLWQKMSVVKTAQGPMRTSMLVCEHGEKLAVAKEIHSSYMGRSSLFDFIIKEVVQKRPPTISDSLTIHDLYFREISKIEEILVVMFQWEVDHLQQPDLTPSDVVALVEMVNELFVDVVGAAYSYRSDNHEKYDFQQNLTAAEYLPWTSSELPEGVRALLLRQCSVNTTYAFSIPRVLQPETNVFKSYASLVELILFGLQQQLESLVGKPTHEAVAEKIERERHNLIMPLIKSGEFDKAALLAEKYLDFNLMIHVCEELDDTDRVKKYCIAYRDEGFLEYLFKWHQDCGKRGRLLRATLFKGGELTPFFMQQSSFRWLYYLKLHKFEEACSTLKELATNECNLVSKKKTLLSMCKLAAYASEVPETKKNEHIEAVNYQLDLISYQETLPSHVCQVLKLDMDNCRVLSPEELILFFISDENIEANQYDYMKALELLDFIPKERSSPEVQNLSNLIWCKLILHDNWEVLDASNPIVSLKSTLFYHTVELALKLGADIGELLPPLENLLSCPKLAVYAENHLLSFFLMAAYEHFHSLSI